MALGTLFGGWRIVHTMGSKITRLTPMQGFCAETGGAITLFAATWLGIPVSTTHTITGAIVGVGAARRVSAVRWGIAGNIVIAWIITLPAAGADRGAVLLAHRPRHLNEFGALGRWVLKPQAEPMRLAHISDLHFGHHDPAISGTLAADVAAQKPDVLVASGDFTQRGTAARIRDGAGVPRRPSMRRSSPSPATMISASTRSGASSTPMGSIAATSRPTPSRIARLAATARPSRSRASTPRAG